jgi:catechol 2,3-dioxygenase-like lactoylglutathione lyase family enzyme/DNA-binding CsgD family transcriptional regulator
MSLLSRRGRPPHPDILTPAEWEVLDLLRHGLNNRRIARLRRTSLDATKFHVANLLLKLDLPDRAALRNWQGGPAFSAIHSTGGTYTMSESTLSLGPIGQISRHVSDIKKAEEWYRDVLGLPHLFTFGNLAFFDCGGTRLFLSTPEEGQSLHEESVIYFRVPDINQAYTGLQSRGAVFEGAPHMIHRHADGTEEWMAFFRDPDNGLLGIMAQVKA